MAKTIKEMAEKSLQKINPVAQAATRPEECPCGLYVREQMIYMYVNGANTVLEEIEKCLEEPSMIQGYSDILAKVKQLKGE